MFDLLKMVTSMPLVVRASFLFSGMFGLRLEGLKSSDGQPVIVQSSVPLNFSVPASILDANSGGGYPNPETFINSIPDRTNNQRCLGKCKSDEENTSPGGIQLLDGNGLHLLEDNANKNNNAKSKQKPCGPGHCTPDEICVSWSKQGNHRRRESPMMVHECLPNDGNHWNKLNPTSGKLCEDGKTHSILTESQSCLNDGSCGLIWKYVCVDEKDSPHSCKLRKCPFDVCIEQIHCGLEPPCYTEAYCVPEHLLVYAHKGHE